MKVKIIIEDNYRDSDVLESLNEARICDELEPLNSLSEASREDINTILLNDEAFIEGTLSYCSLNDIQFKIIE